MKSDVQLPSDFLIDNHKSLQRRLDFEDMCESLDELQFEAVQEAFQQGIDLGQEKTLQNLREQGVLIEGFDGVLP
jgi:hypothetical protein